MGVVSRSAGGQDIRIRQDVELLFRPASGGIDWEEDGPCDGTAHEADHNRNLEESEQEVTVNGLMVEDVAVGDLEEWADPVEQAGGHGWGSFPAVTESVHGPTGELQCSERTVDEALRDKSAGRTAVSGFDASRERRGT